MNRKSILAGLSLVICASLLLSACAAQATPTASNTVDPNMIYTEAAQTVAAGQAMTEAARPTEAATATLQPSATMDSTASVLLTQTSQAAVQPGAATTLTPAETSQPGVLVSATPGGTPLVLATATSASVLPPANTGDKCEWVSNNPADNTQISKNASFDATIRVRNSGTTTWDARYALRYFGGERMGTPTDLQVNREVKPNETYDFVFTMTMPASTGKKEVLLAVQNADGRNLCFINLPYEVID